MKKIFLSIATLFLLLLTASAQEEAGLDPVDTITRKELKDHVYFLASDEMGGRVIYEDDYKAAAQHCGNQFQLAGLKPVKKAKGDEAYLHEVLFVMKTIRSACPLTIRNASSIYTFDAAVETRYLFQADTSVFSKGKPIVFVGYGISAPKHGWNDFEGLKIDGKITLVLPGAPKQNGQPVLPADIHKELDSTNPIIRWLRKYQLLEKLDAEPAAIVIVSDEIINKKWENVGGNYEAFKVYLAKDANMPESENNVMLISINIAKALFKDQVYNPIASEAVDLNEYQTFELKDVDMNLEVNYELEKFPSWNVIGMVEGSDPKLKDEYIIVGGHLDHVPPSRGQILNGADDNASGCAGVLEVAEAMAISSPKRSVIFCLWTGEEPLRGDTCMGSKYFVDNPPIPFEKIKAYINVDMIGRTRSENELDRAHIIGSTEEMLPAVVALVKPINEQKVNWPIIYEEILGSDHMSFLDVNIPAFTFFSGHHRDVHTPRDDPEKIDYEKMEKLSQLIYWITIELANNKKYLNVTKTINRDTR